MVRVPPDHPCIRYVGRFHDDPGAPSFALPGTSIRIAFAGERIELDLEDFGGGTETTTNYYAVAIDGREPTVIEARPGRHRYAFDALGAGQHEIEVFKETEGASETPRAGRGTFHGFHVDDASAVAPPRARAHRVEFIGDSITAGYGARLSTHDPATHVFTTKSSDAWGAWGAVAARMLDADYMAVAFSGRGVSRNHAGRPGPTVPELYRLITPDEPTKAWDARRFAPEAIVIGLGTNDFSTVDEPCSAASLDAAHERFVAAYLAFLEQLRRDHPAAPIFLATSPMLEDTWPVCQATAPSAADGAPQGMAARAASRLRADLHAIRQERARRGDSLVDVVEIPPQRAPFGVSWHPTAATQRANGELVARVLADKLGWSLRGSSSSR